MSKLATEAPVEPVAASERVAVTLSPEYSRVMGDLCSTPAFGADGGFDLAGLRRGMGTRREPEVPGICIEQVEAGGVPAQWVYLPGCVEAGRMMYLHGGGYVSGSGDFYLPLAAELARATGCALLLPDYRLAPEYPHPTAVQDAVAAFTWMCAHGPREISLPAATFIGGDSAGGGLTLSTLIALRDALPRYALPNAAVTISAYTDLAHRGVLGSSRWSW